MFSCHTYPEPIDPCREQHIYQTQPMMVSFLQTDVMRFTSQRREQRAPGLHAQTKPMDRPSVPFELM